ncbi:hypothetical protein B0A52_00668 [Exophiala mesophila]|uniref:alpha-1,2-Mannosidase n=1 Tax=Exophiala mesophila TaxID=212818 RepID=A0A438NHV9_EXOME|nr:hypothetical protein B0A52_00668 [Exophiala mesophila]
MTRLRRYRVFLIVAVLSTFTLWHLSRLSDWTVSTLGGAVGFRPKPEDLPPPVDYTEPIPLPIPEPQEPPVNAHTPVIHPVTPTPTPSPSPKTPAESPSPSPDLRPTVTGEELLAKPDSALDDFGERGQGRLEVQPRPHEQPKAYWKQQEEHFPVPPDSLKTLPTAKPKTLPKIQYTFGKESATKKVERQRRQTTIRESFKHAWYGYTNFSLGHDELKPLSGGSGNPFNGWGATLVDSLDTLWIMGLYDEFDRAVSLVKDIDFKTSTRKDIPLFETTIRYLGGLLGAYDLSDGKYHILLTKAVELAEVLMGAFDTPNRMPIGYYNWAPSYASQPHRASTHMVLAELGSLSVEFTRLAQITKEDKYYDAIARITDALEKWQMKTTLPGLWPLKLDASGCKKPEIVRDSSITQTSLPVFTDDDSVGKQPPKGEVPPSPPSHIDDDSSHHKRELSEEAPPLPKEEKKDDEPKEARAADPLSTPDFDEIDCEPQGLSTEPHSDSHRYGIGALADSTYEYLPKEYALLGGVNDQYKTMYEQAMKVVREELLFRPMIKEDRDILFVSKQSISPHEEIESKRKVTKYEGSHLGCFAGGMFALGSKMFDIPEDMTLARKLTEGCVWAYESMPVGIMAESFELVPCESMTTCPWDEKKWHKALDPYLNERFKAVDNLNREQERLHEEALANAAKKAESDGADDDATPFSGSGTKRKRDAEDNAETEQNGEAELPSRTVDVEDGDTAEDADREVVPSFVPRVALSHDKYVAARISEERLGPGYTNIGERDYRLRPEAIESVFIMYRITGDESWMEKGWKMFLAVDQATKSEVAHAVVRDVTSLLNYQDDTMESFWLAETLKYYYLLFSEPSLVSLDDYVLNTEAHPFKRPVS